MKNNAHPRLPKSFLPFFLHFVKKQPISFAIFFAAPLVHIFEVTIIPFALKLIIDCIESDQVNRATIFSDLAPAFWLFGISWFFIITIARLQNWWQAYTLPLFQVQIRQTALEYLSAHSFKFFADNMSGNLSKKIADLADSTLRIHYVICWNIISALGVISASVALIYPIAPIFVWILSIWIIVVSLIVLAFAPKIDKASAINAEDKSMLTGSIVDILSNITAVKLFASRQTELQRFGKLQKQEQNSNKKMILAVNANRFFLDLSTILMLAFLVYFLVSKWQSGVINSGDFVFIFNVYIGIMNIMWHLSESLPDLFGDIGIVNQALSVINRPHTITNKPDAAELKVTKGEIQFKNVEFGYKENDEDNIFQGKNLLIPAKQKVGLVGFSGSGKTTFINLILRFFDIKKGQITIDEQNIAHVTQESLRSNIAVIPQDTPLFHRSLMENIRYGRFEASDEEVIMAAKLAHCHEFILELPEGYDTLVGERGVKLSGGQRQRIAIARCLLKNAPILILDEATSALDSVTEKLIQDSIQTLVKDKTTIVIAHRLSTLVQMDRILVFSKGKVIEDGSHEELLKAKGHYAKMWKMQAGGFLPEEEKR